MQTILREAHQAYSNQSTEARLEHEKIFGTDQPFVFLICGRPVCHKAFVNYINVVDYKGHKIQTWNDEVAICLGEYNWLGYYYDYVAIIVIFQLKIIRITRTDN